MPKCEFCRRVEVECGLARTHAMLALVAAGVPVADVEAKLRGPSDQRERTRYACEHVDGMAAEVREARWHVQQHADAEQQAEAWRQQAEGQRMALLGQQQLYRTRLQAERQQAERQQAERQQQAELEWRQLEAWWETRGGLRQEMLRLWVLQGAAGERCSHCVDPCDDLVCPECQGPLDEDPGGLSIRVHE